MTPVTIDKLVAGIQVTFNASAGTYAMGTDIDTSEWELDTANGFLYWRGYIDLSGNRVRDQVFFPTNVQCQLGGTFMGSGSSALLEGGHVLVQYALTTDRLDDLAFGSGRAAEPLAGYLGDNTDMQQIIMGSTNTYGPSLNSELYSNIACYNFGGGVPVVTDRIYIAIRVMLVPPVVSSSVTNATWFIPPKRFVLTGESGKVQDHELIYLMARQYEAQKRIDVT